MEVKTREQRVKEVEGLLKAVDNSKVIGKMPEDIASIGNQLDGVDVVTFLKGVGVISKSDLNEIVTKKGKTLYQLFTTGNYGLMKLHQIGNRVLKAKVTLFLE